MSGPLTVLVRDPANFLTGVIEPTSIELIPRFNAVGTWQVKVPLNSKSGQLLERGSTAVFRDEHGTVISGSITQPRVTHDEDDVERLTISGLSDEHQLADRRCYPDPAHDPLNQTTARHIVTGVLSTVLRTYVDLNCGPGARAERQSGIVLETPDPVLGPVIEAATRFDQLLDLLQDLARRVAGMGFRVVRGLQGPPEFQVFMPRDLTAEIILSHGLNNLKNSDYSLSAPTGNYVIGAGTGVGVLRAFTVAEDTASIAAWHRRIETFYDVRNEDDPVKLQQDTDAQLEGKGETGQVAFEAIDTDRLVFRRDYDLGDKITVEVAPGVKISQVIREVRISQDETGNVTYSPRVGDDGASATPSDRLLLADAMQRISRIETRQ